MRSRSCGSCWGRGGVKLQDTVESEISFPEFPDVLTPKAIILTGKPTGDARVHPGQVFSKNGELAAYN